VTSRNGASAESVPRLTDDQVLAALARVIDPEIRKPITELDMVSGVSVAADGHVTVGIRLTIVGCPAAQRIEADALRAAESVAGAGNVTVEVTVMTREQRQATATEASSTNMPIEMTFTSYAIGGRIMSPTCVGLTASPSLTRPSRPGMENP
jgi:ATP-binding protein involved in chromosome partitioning